MSKKLVWILAGVMAIVMIGLILVQTYWISNAFNIKEKQFAQLVARSMSNFSNELENREAAHLLNQFISPEMAPDTTGGGGFISIIIWNPVRRCHFFNQPHRIFITTSRSLSRIRRGRQ